MAKKPLVYDNPPAKVGDDPGTTGDAAVPEPVILPMKPFLPCACSTRVTVPPEMLPQNSACIVAASRRIREAVMEAQQRRGSGHVSIDFYLEDGACSRAARIRTDWTERI